MQLTVTAVASILGTKPGSVRRRLKEIIQPGGFINFEDFVLWVEKHSDHVDYESWINSLKRIEAREKLKELI